jgi:hypothetical protein
MSTSQEETKALFRKQWSGPAGRIGRQLRALDPTGRQLVIRCGCAVFNARVGLAVERAV